MSNVIKKEEYFLRTNKHLYSALDFEKYYRYELACQKYEFALMEDEKHVYQELYINLAFIYWRSSGGWSPSDNDLVFPYILGAYGGLNYKKILDQGIEKFPNNFELRYWKIYFEYYINYDLEDSNGLLFADKINQLLLAMNPLAYKQENYTRTLGFKPEYLFYSHLDFPSYRKELWFPKDYDTEIVRLRDYTSNPQTCKNRFIYDYVKSS